MITDTNVGMVPDELVINLDHSAVEGRRAGRELAHVNDDCLILLCNRRVPHANEAQGSGGDIATSVLASDVYDSV